MTSFKAKGDPEKPECPCIADYSRTKAKSGTQIIEANES